MYSGNKGKVVATDDQLTYSGGSGQHLTVHNWRIESSLAHETRESCNGHCQATCRRDKRTGLLIAFDAEGQRPRQDAYWSNTTRSELQGESGTVQDLTPLGEIW